jgi:hypothetical protein
VIDVGDNGKITDKGQFGHEPPLAGLPCPFKHGGTPVGLGHNHNGNLISFMMRSVSEPITCIRRIGPNREQLGLEPVNGLCDIGVINQQ